jgi:hypothetical protein
MGDWNDRCERDSTLQVKVCGEVACCKADSKMSVDHQWTLPLQVQSMNVESTILEQIAKAQNDSG